MTYAHPDAYCLLAYLDDEGTTEFVWNARDGAAPLFIPARGGGEAHLTEINDIARMPDYDPPAGSRVLLDPTLEMALAVRRAQVEEYWDRPEGTLRAQFASQAEAAAALANADLARPGSPLLVEVTAEIAAALRGAPRG